MDQEKRTDLIDNVDILHPQQPHCATVLLLDISSSMWGDNIKQVNEGLKVFKDDILKDELARKRIDLAIITFSDDINIAHNFSSIEEFNPPILEVGGSTCMGSAIIRAIDIIEERKNEYKTKGIDYFRPWIFMITDGEPTDMSPGDNLWNNVTSKIIDGETNKKFSFFTVGVDEANMRILAQISPPQREPIRLKRGKWNEMFKWLSASQTKIGTSRPGEMVVLDNPKGWGEIPST